jgi:hypothetical protein
MWSGWSMRLYPTGWQIVLRTVTAEPQQKQNGEWLGELDSNLCMYVFWFVQYVFRRVLWYIRWEYIYGNMYIRHFWGVIPLGRRRVAGSTTTCNVVHTVSYVLYTRICTSWFMVRVHILVARLRDMPVLAKFVAMLTLQPLDTNTTCKTP